MSNDRSRPVTKKTIIANELKINIQFLRSRNNYDRYME